MLAVTGLIVQEFWQLPGTIDLDGTTFASIGNGVAAVGNVPSLGWIQIFALIGFWELIGWEDRKVEGSTPGDFNFGATAVTSDPEKLREFKTKEIQNGRLAMLAIMEILTHNIDRPDEGLFVLHHL